MRRKEFRKLVEEAIDGLPSKIKRKMENVAIVVEDEPSFFQKQKLKARGLIFGLYQGVPKSKRGSSYGEVLPDKITIFQKPIEQVFKTKKQLKERVKKTVHHEIAHHFGFNEKEVRKLERKKYAR